MAICIVTSTCSRHELVTRFQQFFHGVSANQCLTWSSYVTEWRHVQLAVSWFLMEVMNLLNCYKEKDKILKLSCIQRKEERYVWHTNSEYENVFKY